MILARLVSGSLLLTFHVDELLDFILNYCFVVVQSYLLDKSVQLACNECFWGAEDYVTSCYKYKDD